MKDILLWRILTGEEENNDPAYLANKVAAKFIAQEFQKHNLRAVKGKDYFQEFDISINTFPNKVSVKLGDEELKLAVDYLVESSSPSIKLTALVTPTIQSIVKGQENHPN